MSGDRNPNGRKNSLWRTHPHEAFLLLRRRSVKALAILWKKAREKGKVFCESQHLFLVPTADITPGMKGHIGCPPQGERGREIQNTTRPIASEMTRLHATPKQRRTSPPRDRELCHSCSPRRIQPEQEEASAEKSTLVLCWNCPRRQERRQTIPNSNAEYLLAERTTRGSHAVPYNVAPAKNLARVDR